MQPSWSYEDLTRANDAERADVCAILDSAYTDGELDGDEHRQRCATAMSAKTRGQLLGLLSDLQTRTPAFAQRSASPAKVNSNRNWIIGIGAVASVLAAVAAVGLITMWHDSSSPSPTNAVSAPTAQVAAPSAAIAAPSAAVEAPSAAVEAPSEPVEAPTESSSSDGTGPVLPQMDVVGTVSGDFQDNHGHAPEHVTCPGDLPGQLGAFERCTITDDGKRYSADVTVTAAHGNRISTHELISEEGPPPPSAGAAGPGS